MCGKQDSSYFFIVKFVLYQHFFPNLFEHVNVNFETRVSKFR